MLHPRVDLYPKQAPERLEVAEHVAEKVDGAETDQMEIQVTLLLVLPGMDQTLSLQLFSEPPDGWVDDTHDVDDGHRLDVDFGYGQQLELAEH